MKPADPDQPGRAVWDARHRGLTAGLLVVISITAFEALAVATVLPAAASDLGGQAALGWYGWVFSGFMLANLVGIPWAGRLADRGGAAGPLVGGCALFAAGLVAAGLAGSMPVMVAGRIAQGLGAGALSSVAYVAVARGYDSRDQPRMLALLASAWVVPGLMGPAVAAAVAQWLGWRSVFLLLAPATLAGGAMAARGLAGLGAGSAGEGSEPVADANVNGAAGGVAGEAVDAMASAGREAGNDAPSQVRWSLQLAIGAGLAQLGVESNAVPASAAGLVLGAALFVPALRRLLPAGTLVAAPGAPAALAAKGLVTFAFFGAEAFLPLALVDGRGVSMGMAGMALTAGTLCWTSGTWLQERMAGRIRHGAVLRAGCAMVALAIAGAGTALAAPHPAAVAVASWALAGLGIGLAYPSATLIVLDDARGGGEGSAASALQLVHVLGVALGTAAGGAMLAAGTGIGWSRMATIAGIDLAMLAAAALGAAPRQQR